MTEEPIVVEIWERHVSAETGQVLAMVRRRDLEARPPVTG